MSKNEMCKLKSCGHLIECNKFSRKKQEEEVSSSPRLFVVNVIDSHVLESGSFSNQNLLEQQRGKELKNKKQSSIFLSEVLERDS